MSDEEDYDGEAELTDEEVRALYDIEDVKTELQVSKNRKTVYVVLRSKQDFCLMRVYLSLRKKVIHNMELEIGVHEEPDGDGDKH